MKLVKIEVRNYRSLIHDFDADKSFEIELGEGMNAISGPNNVGKSNLLRALAFALDPDFKFNRARDIPSGFVHGKPTVTLTFQVPQRGRASRESTLLKNLDAYERRIRPEQRRTYADDGVIKLRVTIEGSEDTGGARREVFVAKGAGARSLSDDDDLARKALVQFHECFHFVMIRSGESLESLMEGKFRDILRNVLKENLKAAYKDAEDRRTAYCDDLQTGLLHQLTETIATEVRELFPEIDGVSLSPQVLSLDETLSNMRVQVSDRAVTDLADKGTGVRGGLIVAMLRHFVEVGKRSMLFAVEEPESFLHPAAQEQLREDLERLAERKDVSLIVTTHSPHIVSRLAGAKVFALDKTADGRTFVASEADGPAPQAAVLGGLYRDRVFMEWIDRAHATADDTRLVLVVEGPTDRQFIQLSMQRAHRLDLLDGVTILEAGAGQQDGRGGASVALLQALVARATHPSDVTVAVLLDNDEPGTKVEQTLREVGERTKDWVVDRTIFSYRHVFGNGKGQFAFEAEDLWPDHLHESFLSSLPNDEWFKGKTRRPKPEEGWQFDWAGPAKGPLVAHLEQHATVDDCARWVALLERIRKGSRIDG